VNFKATVDKSGGFFDRPKSVFNGVIYL